MPRLKHAEPKYRLHKASGRAIVTLGGKTVYCNGKYGSPESREHYERLKGAWLAEGRPQMVVGCKENDELEVVDLCRRYWEHAKQYYRKNGEPTDTLYRVKQAINILCFLYGHTPAKEFGPRKLKAIQQTMASKGDSRKYANEKTECIKWIFRWGGTEELIPAAVYHAIKLVPRLAKGRSDARERPPVPPVPDWIIDATLPHLSPVVADMVQFQRLTGCRPQEVRLLRPVYLDRSEAIWKYTPGTHKTEHHGKMRVIPVGPKAQEILRPYLLRDPEAYCFSPLESENLRRRERTEARVTPHHYGNAPGTNRQRRPQRSPRDHYTKDSYRKAIQRGCEAAFPLPDECLRREPEPRSAWKARLGAERWEKVREWEKAIKSKRGRKRRKPAFPLPDEYRQRQRETKQAWLARLSADQRLEVKQWEKEKQWFPNQIRHTAATAFRKVVGAEVTQAMLGHSELNTTEIYAERDWSKMCDFALLHG